MIAAWAPDAFHEIAPAELCKKLLQIGERNLLTVGNLGERNGAAARMAGEIGHRHHRIASLRGELHDLLLHDRGNGGQKLAQPAIACVKNVRPKPPSAPPSIDRGQRKGNRCPKAWR